MGKCPKCEGKNTRKLVSKFFVAGRGDLRESTFYHGCHSANVPHHEGAEHSHDDGDHHHGTDHTHGVDGAANAESGGSNDGGGE